MAKNKDKKQAQPSQPFDPQVPRVESKTQPQSQDCRNEPSKR